ncbi:S24 family peptidase [Corticibacter populi]|uniref:S24 family peptidase n=1 Tax=Corticibacter populi TaxID=1550736 RepID=A0A3M6R0V2_9BURK|nr:S24 family peptidase [Corticibacter populi]RMX08519.1 S24 family peptidase [Corticibacter populi]RZS35836.1 phage repressor protein C with HTH and peptisase S24 domain [Corticibacter populi]
MSKRKVTPETLEESAKLRTLWDQRKLKLGLKQDTFGETYKVGNQSAVGQFLRGVTPISLKAAIGFAKGLQCEISDFSPRLAAQASEIASAVDASMIDVGPQGDPPESSEERPKLRRYRVKFSNGVGVGIEEDSEMPLVEFDASVLRDFDVTPRTGVVVGYTGDSNSPTIPDGGGLAVVLLEAEARIRTGRFHAFRLGNDLLFKRLMRLPDGSLLATSDNPKYPPIVIDKKRKSEFDLIGYLRGICIKID